MNLPTLPQKSRPVLRESGCDEEGLDIGLFVVKTRLQFVIGLTLSHLTAGHVGLC